MRKVLDNKNVANLLFNGILVPSSLVAMRLYYSYIQDDFTRHRFISERIVLHEVDVQKVANEVNKKKS